MSLFPGRIGGTRGPDNRTLTDLYNQLAQLNLTLAPLATIAADIAAVRSALETPTTGTNALLSTLLTRTTYLTGATQPNSTFGASLPAYLAAVLGNRQVPRFPIQENVQTLFDYLESIETPLRFIQPLFGPPGLLEVPVGETVYEWVKQLAEVMGKLSDAPSGDTIKELIEAIRDCSCGDTPPPFDPAPPATGCFGSAAAWTECTLSFKFTNTEVDVYQVIFPASVANLPGYTNVQVGSTVDNALSTVTAIDWATARTVCMAWAFQEENPPVSFDIVTSSDIDDALPFNAFGELGNVTPVGEQLNLIPVGAAGGTVQHGLYCNFAFAVGASPVGKVWVMGSAF